MSHLSVCGLSYAHPGGEELFFGVSFLLSPGDRAGLIGRNGVGKSTLLRILAGQLEPAEGECSVDGVVQYMPQDVGFDHPGQTVREMLLGFAPSPLDVLGRSIVEAERRIHGGDPEAGMELAAAIGDWGELGGYELEGQWDAAMRRIVGAGLDEVGERRVTALSGGERKQLVLDVLLGSAADVLLLDEPDNYLDIPAKRWLEERLVRTDKAVLLVSHDRALLAGACTKIMTLETTGAWIHTGSYRTYPETREKRQQALGDELKRWKDEERRLYRHFKILKQRAAQNSRNAPKADAAETRWHRFSATGPPPPPAPDQQVHIRLQGAGSGRRVLRCDGLAIPGLVRPFDLQLDYGEQVGLIGPNGTGKTFLLRCLAGEERDHEGTFALGSRVAPGYFTQMNARPEFEGNGVLDVVLPLTGNIEAGMAALGRYGLPAAAQRTFETLSGGQKARLEVLCLELAGSNLLLLDEPTDNLDIDSATALEHALARFQGAVLAVSHDRAFLATLDRYLLLLQDGTMYDITDYQLAMDALASETGPAVSGAVRPLSVAG